MAQLPHSSPELFSTPPSAVRAEQAKQSHGSGPQRTPSTAQKVAAEFIGTYMLVFIGCGSVFISQKDIDFLGVASAWGVAVVAIVYTFGHISGAHINPAVTIAAAAAGKFPLKLVPFYAVAQVLGSVLASFTLAWLFDGVKAEVMLTLPPDGTKNLKVIAWEIFLTFTLMLVISGAAMDDKGIKELSGVSVGAVIFTNAILGGKITGPSMNPARSIGPAIVTHKFGRLWIYIISPVIGAVAGSTLYNFLSVGEKSSNFKLNAICIDLPV